jgi:hypothetical protein
MQNGDVKRAAGNAVHLVRQSDTLTADMRRTCTTYGERLLPAIRALRAGLADTEEVVACYAPLRTHPDTQWADSIWILRQRSHP